MKTNSLINSIYNRSTIGAPKPEVGMGATMTGCTDRYPGTVVSVEDPGSKLYQWVVEVQSDDYLVIAGSAYDGSATYAFTENLKGGKYLFGFNLKTSKWCELYRNKETGRLCRSDGRGLILGFRERYYDPCL